VRSDASEEPQAQGRSTRAGNRGTTNGRSSNRTIVSDDEEDATSWDGGDEDDEEPEQMDLDDDEEEEDQGEESSEEEEEPQTLMVTLRYGKASSAGPTTGNETAPDATSAANGVDQNGIHSIGALKLSERVPAPVEPTPHPAPPSHPLTAFPSTQAPAASNGLTVQPPLPPVVPAAQHAQPVGDPAILPKLDGIYSAPAQPYTEPQQQTTQQPHGQPTQQQQPFVPPLPSPAPATTWQ
jgi:hypothetical protein